MYIILTPYTCNAVADRTFYTRARVLVARESCPGAGRWIGYRTTRRSTFAYQGA